MALPTALQTAALAQLEAQFWSLMESLHDYFAANPVASQGAAVSYLEGLPDPAAPGDSVSISDRTALFGWIADRVHPYEGQANAYLSLRQLMLDHPKALLRCLDSDAGRVAGTRANVLAERMHARTFGGWLHDGVENIQRSEVRDPAKGNFVTREAITATVDGVQRSVAREIDVQLIAGQYMSTPGPWAVL